MLARCYSYSALLAASLICSNHTSFARQDTSVTNVAATAVSDKDNGLEQITEGRVTGTISFLASDELAGRGTGTNEFNIAAAYVAARFRGAGLVGGAADGGYYHETLKRSIRTPNVLATLESADSSPLEQFGLLSGGEQDVNYSGELTVFDFASEIPESGLQGIVGTVYSGDARGPRLASQITRMVNKVQAAGAKGLLLAVSADSELIALAKQWQEKSRPEPTQSKIAIPILLVSEKTLTNRNIKLKAPSTIVSESPMRNVIGIIPGSDPVLSKEAILFSAHLDHLGARVGPGDTIFNGADDDASGVTAVVTLADAFGASKKPKRTLMFMAFWGEESGLLGSKQFAATPTWPLDKIIANVNIEMIGRPEAGARNKIWMTGWNESNLGKLMNEASSAKGIDIFEHPKFSAQLYRASDNYSFVEKGVIAHSFSAGSLHADYHQPDDEWDRLEIPHMTRVIEGLFYGSQPLADGLVTPIKQK
jgi:hypothetical protein